MMRKDLFATILVYCFFLSIGRVHGLGERTLTLGSAFSWEAVESRQGIIEAASVRPHPVLLLATSGDDRSPVPRSSWDENIIDLYLSFNESIPEFFSDSRGRYNVYVSRDLSAAPGQWVRNGSGAALFSGRTGDAQLVLSPRPGPGGRPEALFSEGSYIRDFSIEFWLYPMSTENGVQILSWTASKNDGRGGYALQRIHCVISRNRLHWSFDGVFFSPLGQSKSLSLSGPPVLPQTWSHHLIRFNADLGLLEYLVDGRLEALDYATSTGRETGEVYTPVIGENSRFSLGKGFSGMMDEFRVYRGCLENPALTRYPPEGGRLITKPLDLGHRNSRALKIEAYGGRTNGRTWNEYAGNGNLYFQDHSGVNFFVRSSNSPYLWNDNPWIPVTPGAELPETVRGRYIQIAADFYPSGNGETTPYLSELKVVYRPAENPSPPTQLTALAGDGIVELSWRGNPSRDVGGYLVYYGTARGEYFGEHAVFQSIKQISPIDVGSRTSVRIEGLDNGTLYYFAVAAYSLPEAGLNGRPSLPIEPGEFSREAAARPLRR